MHHNHGLLDGEQASPPTAALHTGSTQLPGQLGCVSFAFRVLFPIGPHILYCRPVGPPSLKGETPFISALYVFLPLLRRGIKTPRCLLCF